MNIFKGPPRAGSQRRSEHHFTFFLQVPLAQTLVCQIIRGDRALVGHVPPPDFTKKIFSQKETVRKTAFFEVRAEVVFGEIEGAGRAVPPPYDFTKKCSRNRSLHNKLCFFLVRPVAVFGEIGGAGQAI